MLFPASFLLTYQQLNFGFFFCLSSKSLSDGDGDLNRFLINRGEYLAKFQKMHSNLWQHILKKKPTNIYVSKTFQHLVFRSHQINVNFHSIIFIKINCVVLTTALLILKLKEKNPMRILVFYVVLFLVQCFSKTNIITQSTNKIPRVILRANK